MKAQKAQMYKGIGWQVRQYFSLLWLWKSVFGQVHYSIVEESRKGSTVGNIASDLGLNVKELTFKRLRIDSHVAEEYFTINLENGELCSKEKIDRETLCASVSTCILTFDVVVENPLNVFHVAVEIQDINDNPPRFSHKIIELEISEVTSVGTCFVLQNAEDPDVGINSIRNYRLSRNQNFVLKEKNYTQENVFPELVLEKALDRETQNTYELILTAADGGNPIRTGTVFIKIYVTDFNDNFPEFSEEIYKANVKESTSVNSTILFVNATDKDEGFNADITYSIGNIPENGLHTFSIHPKTGEIKNKVHLDFEKTSNYEMSVQAKDGGGLVAHAKVLIQIIDENDNAPEISISSLSTPIPENSTPGTVVALIKVYDQDSGNNGDVDCKIIDLVPFKLVPSSSIYFTIITTTVLDRELVSQYNITIVATDRGVPALFTTKVILLSVSDINDNSPVFEKPQYIAYVSENNQPGASIYKVHALDLDAAENATLTYSILAENMDVFPVFSYLSINPTTGVLYAQRSFDYEEHKEFYIQVIAKDNGSPQLSNNASIKICVVDKNDNAPKILYPLSETEGSPSYEINYHFLALISIREK
ncbi:protocadherin gamma-B1-like [Spea bombifrons]|uniref:protocadherin gamma-B1-like n=1 Tax=Spea bombifrons TaxID=233779 RepID=UPI00234BF58C|nr:protocadherin gamma-B1-like [Spea bombifrons]